MKKTKFFSVLFVCLFALGFSACDDNDNDAIVDGGGNTNQNNGNNNNGGDDDTTFELIVENFYGEWECKSSNMLYSFPEDTTTTELTGPSIFIQKNDDYNYNRFNGTYTINSEAATLSITEGAVTKNYTITKADSIELVLKNEEEISYTFKRFSDTINNEFPLIVYNAVDLGLSVKWADRNVGAIDTTSNGNYFAWGEKNSKKEYTQRDSKTFGKTFYDIIGKVSENATIEDGEDVEIIGDFICKKVYEIPNKVVYTINIDTIKFKEEGKEDSISITAEEAEIYDAARENCGEEWRIPTEKEFTELMEKCTWEWTTINEVNGYKVTGTNGNYIFLPAAGFYGNSKTIRHEGEYGYYTTSTTGDNTEDFRNLRFWNYEPNIEWGKRIYGRTIRAVAAN